MQISQSNQNDMSCFTCLDTELKNPMQDCQNANYAKCQSDGEKSYCLTRQTQNGKGF